MKIDKICKFLTINKFQIHVYDNKQIYWSLIIFCLFLVKKVDVKKFNKCIFRSCYYGKDFF